MAPHHRAEEGAEVIGFEIDEDEAEQARANVETAELVADVTVETDDALEIIPRLEGEFDMVFLDADKEEYFNYLALRAHMDIMRANHTIHF